MLNSLQVINLPANFEDPKDLEDGIFVMKTCQRTLIIGMDQNILNGNFQYLKGDSAYQFLLEVICGIHSELIGETEIVAQFKQALAAYLKMSGRNPAIVKLLEKLLQDGKYLRTEYMQGIGQKTYALIAKTLIYSRKHIESVLILGSGQLAKDLINQFRKRIPVYLSARNQDSVAEFAANFQVEVIPWLDENRYRSFSHIINTIGCDETLLGSDFLWSWHQSTHHSRLLIDLGVPSPIAFDAAIEEDIIRLKEILEEAAVRDCQKIDKIEAVKMAIVGVAQNRISKLDSLGNFYR